MKGHHPLAPCSPGMRVTTRCVLWSGTDEVPKGATGCVWDVQPGRTIVCVDNEACGVQLVEAQQEQLVVEGLLPRAAAVAARSTTLHGRGGNCVVNITSGSAGVITGHNPASNTYVVKFAQQGISADMETREVQPVVKKTLLQRLFGLKASSAGATTTGSPKAAGAPAVRARSISPSSQRRKKSYYATNKAASRSQSADILNVGYYRPAQRRASGELPAEETQQQQQHASDEQEDLSNSTPDLAELSLSFPIQNLQKVPKYSCITGSPRARRTRSREGVAGTNVSDPAYVSPTANTSVSFPEEGAVVVERSARRSNAPQHHQPRLSPETLADLTAPISYQTARRTPAPRPAFAPIHQVDTVHVSSINSNASSASSAFHVFDTTTSSVDSHTHAQAASATTAAARPTSPSTRAPWYARLRPGRASVSPTSETSPVFV